MFENGVVNTNRLSAVQDSDQALEDTAVLQRTLDRLAELGYAEAKAAPIED